MGSGSQGPAEDSLDASGESSVFARIRYDVDTNPVLRDGLQNWTPLPRVTWVNYKLSTSQETDVDNITGRFRGRTQMEKSSKSCWRK